MALGSGNNKSGAAKRVAKVVKLLKKFIWDILNKKWDETDKNWDA